MSMSEIAMLIIVSTTSLGGCLGFIFHHIRRSRCKSVKCCCFKCMRDVMTDQEMAADKFQGMTPPAVPPMMQREEAGASGPSMATDVNLEEEIRVDNSYDDIELGYAHHIAPSREA